MKRQALAMLLLVVVSIPGAVVAQQPSQPAVDLYERAMNLLIGSGINRNDLQAMDLLRRSAELGYAPAQDAIGYAYDLGTLVPADPQQAASWYLKSAEQGDRLAQWSLGRLYMRGDRIPADLQKAESWLSRAAEQGDAFGQYLLGRLREDRQEYDAAESAFTKAAQQGLPQAQRHLALRLISSQHPDKYHAYIWLLLSFEAGAGGVGPTLSRLEGDLGSNEVERAKQEARKLQQTVSRSVNARGCTGWNRELDDMPSPPPILLQRFCR